MRWAWLASWVIAGCGEAGPAGVVAPEPAGARTQPLPIADQAIRVSMAVRGVRPTSAELDAVRADPAALGGLVDAWLEDPAFGETVRDMHAELFQVRSDVHLDMQMPSMSALAAYTGAEINAANEEEPLRLIELIVTEDRPYTEIVQSKTMVANEIVAAAWGLAFDEGGPEWQETTWADGRPMAGVLSSSELYRRHVSNGTNFHRGRARILTRALVCDDFAIRDLPLQGSDLDLADPAVVADAVVANPACAGCHQALDGAAAFLWGFHEGGLAGPGIRSAINAGCVFNPETTEPPNDRSLFSDHCYPLVLYSPVNEDGWDDWDLRSPAWYGQPGRDLVDLGAMIAVDPRFSLCTARRFHGWLTQTPTEEVPDEVAAELQTVLVESGFSAKALVRAIVLSEGFLAAEALTDDAPPVVPTQVVRPEQYARAIERLTGFSWLAAPDEGDCLQLCLKQVDLSRSDRYGFRAMAGGIDGFEVLDPTHAATPVKVLVMSRFATEAAAWVVRSDLADETDLLLHLAGPIADDETVRAQIVALHADILGESLAPDDPAIDATVALFETLSADHDVTDTWTLVVSALLQDPAMVFY